MAVLGVDDIKAQLSDKLKVEFASCSMEEYFSNHLYVGDLKTVKTVVNSKNEEQEAFFGFIRTKLNATIKKIERVYTHLFSSSYEVIKPDGILCSDGILSIDKGGIVKIEDYAETAQVYSILMECLGYCESKARDFDANEIVSTFGSNGKVMYYPYKMLEFAFGRVGSREDGTYKRTSDAKSWELYWEKQVKSKIEASCKKIIWEVFSQKGLIGKKGYKSKDSMSFLDTLLDHLYKNLTPCILTISMSRTREGDEYLGFKYRCTDLGYAIPLDPSLPKRLVDECFNGNIGSSDAVYESVVPLMPGNEGYYVVDIQHKFNPQMVNASPLFAYTALNALANSGKTISWDALILGKRDDDSILTAGAGKSINFSKNFMHWIIAGSRSGKGVMTLNILASALASGKPVFYLDNKPDMVSMLRSSQLSGGKIFGVNGDYDATFDKTFDSCQPGVAFNWEDKVPPYLKEHIGGNYLSYAPIYYLRTVMFMMSLIYVRGMVRSDPAKYNPLGGKDGIICVIDEITAGTDKIKSLIENIFGSAFYHNSVLNMVRAGKSTGKVDFNEFGCYSTDFINAVNSTILRLKVWQQKGLSGGGTEGDVSNVFVLGQTLESSVDLDKLEYRATTDGRLNMTSGNVFYNFLFRFGPNDGFFGYNQDRPGYMNVVPGSKSETRLNESARNFAYVKTFDENTFNTMNKGIPYTKGISDNALYFKPFLILNDAEPENDYVNKDLRRTCELAGLDFEEVKNLHRNESGVLMPEIGFIPYIEKMMSFSGDGGAGVRATLEKSYNIANALVQAYIPGYQGDCIDFIYDLRPEAMFTADSLLLAYDKGEHESVSKLHDEFFGTSPGGTLNLDSIDLNNLDDFMPEEPEHKEEPVQQAKPFPVREDMAQSHETRQTEPKKRTVSPYEKISVYADIKENFTFSDEVRWHIAKVIAFRVYKALGANDNNLLKIMVETAYNDLIERGY